MAKCTKTALAPPPPPPVKVTLELDGDEAAALRTLFYYMVGVSSDTPLHRVYDALYEGLDNGSRAFVRPDLVKGVFIPPTNGR